MPFTKLMREELLEEVVMSTKESLLLSVMENKTFDLLSTARKVQDLSDYCGGLSLTARSNLRITRIKLASVLDVIDDTMNDEAA